jgi:LmeA-like phospholipid-binding
MDTSGDGGAMSDGSTLRMPAPGAPGLPRRRRRRWPWVVLGIVLVLVALFVVLDRVAVAYAENQAAQQMQSQGFPTKPDVTIKGFPFLTQVAAKRINDVHITASNVPAGPVKFSFTADATDVLLNPGYQSGTISHVTGTGVIPFSNVASALGGGGSGLTISSAGGNNVKLSVNVAGFNLSMTGSVEQTGPSTVKVHLNPPSGLPVSLPIPSDFTIHIPTLPMHLTIQSVKVTGQGLVVHASGSDIKFTQSGGLG